MTFTKDDAIVTAGLAGAIFGVASLIFCAITATKANKDSKKVDDTLNDITKKFDGAVTNIKNSTEVEISEKLIEKAVTEAVNEQAEKKVAAAIIRVVDDTEKDMRRQVSHEVNGVYKDIKGSVVKEVNRQVGEINIRDIRREAIDDAKREAKEQFTDALDEIKDDYSDWLKEAVEDLKEKAEDDIDELKSSYKGNLNALTDALSIMKSAVGAK